MFILHSDYLYFEVLFTALRVIAGLETIFFHLLDEQE